MHLLQSCSLVSVNLGFQDEGHKECMFDDAQASGAANPYLRTELQPLWKSEVCPTLGVQVKLHGDKLHGIMHMLLSNSLISKITKKVYQQVSVTSPSPRGIARLMQRSVKSDCDITQQSGHFRKGLYLHYC